MKNKNTNGGFIQIIFLFIVFSIIVWYFKININGYIDSHPQVRDLLNSMINYLKSVWKSYLAGAWAFIWNNVIIDILWKNLAPLIHKV